MSDDLKPILEALIFASPDPLTPATLFELLDGTPKEAVEEGLAALQAEYGARGGLQMVQVAGGYQICTRPELHEWVRRLFHEHSKQRLSVPALETLAVVAYKQPITSAEIAEIRGVNVSGVVGTLLDRRLVKVVGRKQVVGRPFLYATTLEFLNQFGLSDLGDLPKIEEMAEALGMDVPPGLAGEPADGPGPSADAPETVEPADGPGPSADAPGLVGEPRDGPEPSADASETDEPAAGPGPSADAAETVGEPPGDPAPFADASEPVEPPAGPAPSADASETADGSAGAAGDPAAPPSGPVH